MSGVDFPTTPELQELEDRLRHIIETILELAIGIHDYESVSHSKDAVVARVNLLTAQLSTLDEASKRTISDVLVPREIIQYIEDGRNPKVYTREFVELLSKQNQFVNGKMHAMRDFRDELAEQIKQTYPELTKEVDLAIENTGPSFPKVKVDEPDEPSDLKTE
ncbi:transcription factor subunit Med10 of mediator complex-domain-containing protein [Kockiozyma suomiensis]|uniref:transcription factor subunit Med10 of mediator complex-domain-containing protein n=1 Tax=Kockiozyma suomiensis TaxID=1337062 RepID=UPI0033434E05